ncbi:hypothetical protein [Desulfovibrio ferrophilus]|uniref:Uncharacterized protein n=1 Tax=Desulfovibrio ferrophilus TaxID=241368 RepID=A0A2Z6AVQ3_9BACT|nr:hypothetical protein [Desulfovibrio ferrophilus]BBD07255.1 uncharacterized protein DFE_0529 [Desulfovibrio ferrophilus]
MSDEIMDLASLDMDELLPRLEGGLFALFHSEEHYADLVKIATALGLKDFVTSKVAGRSKEEVLGLFSDGEEAISEFLHYAADKGLLELSEDETDTDVQ